MSEKRAFASALVTEQMKKQMTDAVAQGRFINESDLIRQGIRTVLREEAQ